VKVLMELLYAVFVRMGKVDDPDCHFWNGMGYVD